MNTTYKFIRGIIGFKGWYIMMRSSKKGMNSTRRWNMMRMTYNRIFRLGNLGSVIVMDPFYSLISDRIIFQWEDGIDVQSSIYL